MGVEAKGTTTFLRKEGTGIRLLREDPLPGKKTNVEASRTNRHTIKSETTTARDKTLLVEGRADLNFLKKLCQSQIPTT